METIKSLVGLVVDRLEPIANTETVVGDPVAIGEYKVIPISEVGFGFGGGGGGGEGEGMGPHAGPWHDKDKKQGAKGQIGGKGKGAGGGAGAGVRIRPVAVIVVGPQGVQTLPVDRKKGKLEKLVDMLPDVVAKVEQARSRGA